MIAMKIRLMLLTLVCFFAGCASSEIETQTTDNENTISLEISTETEHIENTRSIEIETTQEISDNEKIRDCIQTYINELVQTLDQDSERTYSPEEFASINGYIISKVFVWGRDSYKHCFESGITDVIVNPIVMKEVIAYDSNYEVSVLLTYSCTFNSYEKSERACLYRCTIEEYQGDYKVVDIDTADDYLVSDMKAGLLLKKQQGEVDEVKYVDERVQEWYDAMSENVP